MLHARDTVRDALEDDVFASNDLSVSMPKYRIPDGEQDPRHAYQVVADELLLDGNSRQNLATFCQTWLEPEVHRLMDLTLDKNMIDKDEYPQTAELEARCVHILADRTATAGRRDGEPAELYNDGQAFKVTCRDASGVIVTLIADNYFGYCKKEVKTQISYAANLFGNVEEEHAGGALRSPATTWATNSTPAITAPTAATFADVVRDRCRS